MTFMPRRFRTSLDRRIPVLCAAWLALAATVLAASEGIQFLPSTQRLSADIEDWSLPQVLQSIADATHWEVYFEPDTVHQASTRFRELAPGDALQRLLSPLDFALLPSNQGAPRLFVYQTSLNSATERVLPSPESVAQAQQADSAQIDNELIVSLKDGADAEALAARLGGRIVGRSADGKSIRLEFDDAEAADTARAALEADPDVESIDSNFAIQRPPTPQQLAAASARPPMIRPKVPPAGEGLVVGLVDTRVEAPNGAVEGFLLPALSVAGIVEPDPDSTAGAGISHGAAMAETILRGLEMIESESSTVRILPVDIYGANAQTSTFDVANGIAAAVNEGARIINLSLGGNEPNGYLERMINDLYTQGILFVGAAGNQPVTTPTYPAAYDPVLAVTAGDRRGNIASYANRGEFVDVLAPGASIVHSADNRVFYGSGTSYAAAYVSGVAGGIASQPDFTLEKVETELRKTLALDPKDKR